MTAMVEPTNTYRGKEQIVMGNDYCRIEDDSSYDYSDYDEGKGYYEPYKVKEEPDYDPIEQPEMAERLKEVKQRRGITDD